MDLLLAIGIVGALLVGESAWSEWREARTRREAARRGTLTARYGIPWR